MAKINLNSPPTYVAVIEYWSRGQRRNGDQWSTRRCQEVLREMGFDSQPCYDGRPKNALIQKVVLQGTREEVLRDRKLITNRLRMLAGGKIPLVFKLVTKPGGKT